MRTIFGETYGIKMWWYWKHLEELFRDLIRSYCSQQKNFPQRFPQSPKKKKLGLIKCMSSLLVGHMKIKVLKIVLIFCIN
jgi:hypothetical protein